MQSKPDSWTIRDVLFPLNDTGANGDRVAIEFIGGNVWTLSDLRAQALMAAGELHRHGVRVGDTVVLMADDPERFTRYWLGIALLGATMVAINTGLQGQVLTHQLQVSKARYAVCDAEFESVLQRASDALSLLPQQTTGEPLPQADIYPSKPSDLACIMFTSGTSGPSKGVEMPNAHCVLFAVGTIDNYQLQQDDCFYICLPLFHANGLFMQLLACLLSGCRAVVRRKFSASNWLADIRRCGATHTNTLGAVAAFITALPPTEHDKSHSLRLVGAAPLTENAERGFREQFGVQYVVPLYGMTEVNIPLYGALNETAPGTCGREYSKYFDVCIRDPDTDQPVADNTTGEIMVRPKLPWGFMSGYAGMADKTVEAWRNFWFHTGDAGYRRSNGQFVFVDRIKDCIRRRGENISSYEVEQAFLAIDGIAEAAAFAVAADVTEGTEDEVMIALQVTRPVSSEQLREWCALAAQDLAVFAAPRYLLVVESLPKTPTGKIRKVVLREEGITDDTVDMRRG
jgi:crotonobetaine/carnitine-CoA ligase